MQLLTVILYAIAAIIVASILFLVVLVLVSVRNPVRYDDEFPPCYHSTTHSYPFCPGPEEGKPHANCQTCAAAENKNLVTHDDL